MHAPLVSSTYVMRRCCTVQKIPKKENVEKQFGFGSIEHRLMNYLYSN
jgi:hypothetical protein